MQLSATANTPLQSTNKPVFFKQLYIQNSGSVVYVHSGSPSILAVNPGVYLASNAVLWLENVWGDEIFVSSSSVSPTIRFFGVAVDV